MTALGATGFEVAVDDLSGPQIAAFLAEHVEEMKAITPPESKHALDLDGLRVPGVTFWTVTDGRTVVASGALKVLDAGHAEIKSMRTARVYQRRGVASALLDLMIAEAGRLGFRRLSLETGAVPFFAPARALYRTFGFEDCAPFGEYREDPFSAYMTRILSPA